MNDSYMTLQDYEKVLENVYKILPKVKAGAGANIPAKAVASN